MTNPQIFPESERVTGLLDKFQNRLAFQGRSKDTVRAYMLRLKALRLHLIRHHGMDLNRIDHVGKITGAMLEEWQKTLRASESGTSVEASSVTAARSFFAWAYDMGMIDRNPAKVLLTVRTPAAPQPHLQWADVRKVMESPLPESHKLILTLGFLLELRRVSMVSLNVGDVAGRPGNYHIRFYNKGGRTCEKVIPDWLYEAIQHYIQTSRPEARPGDPLFVSRLGERINRRYVNRVCERAGKTSGVAFTPHAMRRTGLSRVNAVQGEAAAREAALHSNASTTRRYLYEDGALANQLFEEMDFPTF